MNKYKVIGGIMDGKEVDLTDEMYVFWELKDGVLTNHEYDILREEKVLVYRETKVYNQNATNINE